jgi:hypothetical protein
VTSGNVKFYDGGTCASPGAQVGTTQTLNGSGQASVATSGLSLGTHVIRACYLGTDNYAASDGSLSYSVVYTFIGFLSPLNPDPTVVNMGNSGRTYPIKWQLKDGSNNYITTAVAGTTISVAKLVCSTLSSDPTDPMDYAADTGGSTLRYDSTANQYIYNWATPGTKNACYRMTVTTPDGQLHVALFQLR